MRRDNGIGKPLGRRPITQILLIEDDSETAGLVSEELASAGFGVECRETIAQAEEALRDRNYDLLVLDRIVPDGDTIEFLGSLRHAGRDVPCLFISAMSSVSQRVEALSIGADDYLVKPFALSELSARANALLRRSQSAPTTLKAGPLTLDLVANCATRGDRVLDLLPKEWALLEYFVRNAGSLVTRSMLLRDVWGYRFEPQSNVVDVHVGKLRRKLELPGERSLIRSIRGKGFILEAEERA